MKPLFTYFVLAYLLSWLIWFPLYGPALGISGLPVLPFHHGIGAWGPLLSSFITTFIFFGKEGVGGLARKCVKVTPLLYLAIAALSPFALALIASLINYAVNGAPVNLVALTHSSDFPEQGLMFALLYNVLFFGVGEEVGWRGFALPRLQYRWNALYSSLLLTVVWAAWHLPLFLYRPGFMTMGIGGAIGWFFSLLTGSVLLTWLYNSSKGSILICALFHATIDVAFTADFNDANMAGYMGALITVWGLLTVIVFNPRDLAMIKRQKALGIGMNK